MAELYSIGVNRIIYKSENFATGKTVTAYFWNPSLAKSALQTFTEIELGLYYLDYNFNVAGTFIGLFYENAVAKTFHPFRVTELATKSQAETINTLCNYIKKLENNRLKIDATANTLTIYDDDGTPLRVFNLKDSVGAPANENIYERVPV